MTDRQPIAKLPTARGAAMGLMMAMPAALMNVVFAAQDPKPQGAVNLTFLVVLVGFVVAGMMAGAEAPWEPTRHGVLAALVAYLPVEIVAVLGRLDRGDAIAPLGIIIVGLLAAAAGAAGSRLGAARRARRNPS